MAATIADIDEYLTEEFYSWRPYKLILARLTEQTGLNRSLSWLKSQFKRLGLRRRHRGSNRGRDSAILKESLKSLIKLELKTPAALLGYRGMWKLLRDKHRIVISRSCVMQALREVDPIGSQRRKAKQFKRRVYYSKGPNYIWHVDGYDKLSKFGFKIHGCIDGCSRKILWLRVSPSNHDPKVIARFFLECVEEVGGVPTILRSDYGTENCNLAAIQIAARWEHSDEHAKERSFLYGPSKRNIRIEAWWSQLRRSCTEWWICLFRSLVEEQLFKADNLHDQACLVFAFLSPLTKQLAEFVSYWNSHRIRKQAALCPHGIPSDLFKFPQFYGKENCLKEVNPDIWVYAFLKESVDPPSFTVDSFNVWADSQLRVIGLSREDITLTNCKSVYLYLRSK